jgi:hypothetical protein
MGIFHQRDERKFLLEVIMTDRFSNFTDLAEHYAREIATPDYARAFMEQTELAKLSIEHEPSAVEMPDPEVAQAAIEMMLATVFDLFRDTRMEDFASEVAWGVANSFHVVAKRLDDREDSMANRLQEKLREYDPSEVYATDLEDLTMQARSLAECRDAMECMRDHAARIYLVETGRPFSPVRGSRVSSKTNASMIEARDYLAAQKAQRREQFAPTGPVVVFSGGQQFTDIALVEDYLDAIHARVPSMALATTAQNKGADVIAAAWASRHNVPVILCKPDTSRGPSAPYQRNARMLAFKPVEAVVCSGGGIQANLADRLREARIPLHIVRDASVQNEAPAARTKTAAQTERPAMNSRRSERGLLRLHQPEGCPASPPDALLLCRSGRTLSWPGSLASCPRQ